MINKTISKLTDFSNVASATTGNTSVIRSSRGGWQGGKVPEGFKLHGAS